jgi:hypothetical protein
VAACSGEQGAISGPKPRPTNLAAQKLELVAEHQQLDVFHIGAAATANNQAEQSPKSEVEEGEDDAADPPSLRRRRRDPR